MKPLSSLSTLGWLLSRDRAGAFCVVLLGSMASLSEAVGISLFVPFLQLADARRNSGMVTPFLASIFHLKNNSGAQAVNSALALILGTVLFRGLFGWCRRLLSAKVEGRLAHVLRTGTFEHLLNIPYGVAERYESGDLINTLSTETWLCAEAFSVLTRFLIGITTCLVFWMFLLWIDPRLTLIFGAGSLLVAVVLHLSTRATRALGNQAVALNSDLAEHMVDGVSGLRVIHAFSLHARKLLAFRGISEKVRRAFLNLEMVSSRSHVVSEVLFAALLLSILFVAVRNDLEVPKVLAFVLLLYRLQAQITDLENHRVKLLGLSGAVQKLQSFLNVSHGKPPLCRSRPLPTFEDCLAFQNVSFRYHPNNAHVLHGVTLRIPFGKTTAIVGASGAGKTTLIRLICRFDDPTGGTIEVDGIPLRTLDLEAWRNAIGLAEQDTHLFCTSIRENIGFGGLEASDQDIERAAKTADAHNFIMSLPEGYQTSTGERGTFLSGGQRQRIALARALLRDPSILILDEATNAVDGITEATIQRALRNDHRKRTIIVVAHRLSSVQYADHVIVMHEGRVVEEGEGGAVLASSGMLPDWSKAARQVD